MEQRKKRVVFVVNPISGTSGKEQILELIGKRLDRSLFDFSVEKTAYAGHASQIAARAAEEPAGPAPQTRILQRLAFFMIFLPLPCPRPRIWRTKAPCSRWSVWQSAPCRQRFPRQARSRWCPRYPPGCPEDQWQQNPPRASQRTAGSSNPQRPCSRGPSGAQALRADARNW